ncbi:GerAB/ArcD/ProY family transporter [Paenibacillus sp. IHBB 3054]|uniref:GerAB/ArcD/ProY family transporter n=1 Tax=Paenibacillus sp. IHBB 3054 TaxID=3425689 RepID=UPI003F66473D
MTTTKWQMFRFTVVYLASQSSMFLIPGLLSTSGYQGWIAIIAGCAMGMIPLFFTIQVGKIKPGEAWVDFGKEIMGKWLHGAMVFLLLIWCVYFVSFDIENFVLFFGANYLRETPPLFVQIVIGLVIMYTAHLGFSTMVYMTDGLFLVFLFSTALSYYLFIPNADYSMLPALLHYHDPGIAFKDSITTMSWFGGWTVFLFVAPDLKIDNKMQKRLIVAGISVMLTVLAAWLITILNFGPHFGKELQFPYLQLIQSSSHDDLLGNSDPILIGLWSASMFIHSSFLIYVAHKCALYLTKQKAKKVMIPFLTIGSITIAYLYSLNLTQYNKNYNAFGTVIIWLIVECIPVYYFIVAFIRSKISTASK